MADVNRRLVLRDRPSGAVTDECFETVEGPIGEPGPGQVLVRTVWLSFDPAQRGWINDVRSYVPPVALGDVMRAWGIGEVVASGDAAYPVGSLVTAMVGWQTHALLDTSGSADLELVPADIPDPKWMLSVAGITGLTAYFGMTDVGCPGEGDTVLVTAAAGATGSVAGQIARILGAGRVVGTAGSEDKQAWVRDVAGFDECVGHHDESVRRRLREQAPNGFNVVFDNVGGALLDAALFNIAERGRIALCGSISTGYRPERPEIGLHYYQLLTTRRARMEGFLVSDYSDRFGAARKELVTWAERGDIHVAEDVTEGLEKAPATLRRLFEGANLGKQLLKVADR